LVTVGIPKENYLEKNYVLKEILGSRLGLDFTTFLATDSYWSFYWCSTRVLRMRSDQFTEWGMLEVTQFDERECLRVTADLPTSLQRKTSISTMPLLRSVQSSAFFDENHDLCIDVLEIAFFFLTDGLGRLSRCVDGHGRKLAKGLYPYQRAVLGRPIVDEIAVILEEILKDAGVDVVGSNNAYSTIIGCDVDNMMLFRGDLSKDVKSILRPLKNPSAYGILDVIRLSNSYIKYLFFGSLEDPYAKSVINIAKQATQAECDPQLFFIPTKNHPEYDLAPDMGETVVQHIIMQARENGGQICLHPGYGTYNAGGKLRLQVEMFIRAIDDAGCSAVPLVARMHFLQWSFPETPKALEEAGVDVDASVAFADQAGFRIGTCIKSRFFDVAAKRESDLFFIPLIAMDRTLLSESYMNLDRQNAVTLLKHLKQKCEEYNGCFNVLIHNCVATTHTGRALLKAVLGSRL